MLSSSPLSLALLAVVTEAANSTSLVYVCTIAKMQAALSADGTLLGINALPSMVTASSLYNATAGAMSTGGDVSATYNYCNVTITYSHTGKNDSILVKFAFPEPFTFKSHHYIAGGSGYTISSDATGGLAYGASGAATSASYDTFDYSYDGKALYGNGSVNWDEAHAFGYAALGEITVLSKYFTK